MVLFKSDGNGGYNIQKGTLAFIMVIIALLSCVATVVAYGVTMRGDINNIQSDQKFTNKITSDNEKSIIINQEKILAMGDNLIEIKADIKELLSK